MCDAVIRSTLVGIIVECCKKLFINAGRSSGVYLKWVLAKGGAVCAAHT